MFVVGLTATANGADPTTMVVVTVLVAPFITETVSPGELGVPKFAT